ncbi:MAG: sulfurtransferase complex subunit TusB [Caldisericales bacterium]|nr:sulfurtransferase complex subunit TusB [Caldisericales bacterium]
MEKKMFIMLTKSPYGCEEGKIRISNALAGDVVVFAQDSVYAATNPPGELAELVKSKMSEGIKFYASGPDCMARGVEPKFGIKQIDYPEMVDLIMECQLSY